MPNNNTARGNTVWATQVHKYMGMGWGYEDIAVKLGCGAESVRTEAAILRQEGRLLALYGVSA